MLGISLSLSKRGFWVFFLVLGVLIVAALRLLVIFSAGIVGFFALFHGHAHGAEIPAAIGAMTYTLGFVLSTLLLHLCGIAIGAAFQKQSAQKAIRFAGGAIAACGLLMIIA